MPRHKKIECERCGTERVLEWGQPDEGCLVCVELGVRQKAIKLGLCDEHTAAMLTISELGPMIEGLEKEGLNINDTPLSMDPKVIIKEMLDIIAIRNALQLPMDTACQRCSMMPMHLAKDCCCHRARKYIGA